MRKLVIPDDFLYPRYKKPSAKLENFDLIIYILIKYKLKPLINYVYSSENNIQH